MGVRRNRLSTLKTARCARCGGSGDDPAMSSSYTPTPCRDCSPPVPQTKTFGQKGGEGPNTGKRAVTYEATAPDGTALKARFFRHPRKRDLPLPVGACVAALLTPINGHPWRIWAVGQDRGDLPGYVFDFPEEPTIVEARRVG